MQPDVRFANRSEAGRRLAARLVAEQLQNPVVYALPRGGVPVAVEIAKAVRAPLDLILVRKIGAPNYPELALGAIVDGEHPQSVINESVRRMTGASDLYLRRAQERELKELERRRAVYLQGRKQIDPADRTAIIVDDGLATGATMKAAITAMKRQGAAGVCVAVPVAPSDTLSALREEADRIICLHEEKRFPGVGSFYDDFHQLTDEETVGLLRKSWVLGNALAHDRPEFSTREVVIPPFGLIGDLCLPEAARGLILFAHGSGSSRLSPRNRTVARHLNEHGFATLLFDLLTDNESSNRRNVFDIPLLAERVVAAVLYVSGEPDVEDLPIGLFGASTGAAAALVAAAELPRRIDAVVSRGGRPDLAGSRLSEVKSPTLLVVGGDDHDVITLNRKAMQLLSCEKLLKIVPGAGHTFEEPGTLEGVVDLALGWFEHYLASHQPEVANRPEGPGALGSSRLVSVLKQVVKPLPELTDPAFASAFDHFGTCRVVLLGEASHGTSEFYRARAAITQRLIECHGFRLVALEADWPDAAVIDREIRRLPRRATPMPPFSRFPTWMWRNIEFEGFVASLRRYNLLRSDEEQVRLAGLDLYSMASSMAAVLDYLDRVDPEAAAQARSRYSCFAPWSREMAAYGRASISRGYALREQAATRILTDLLRNELEYSRSDGADFFDAMQNARLVTSAERYYRMMYYGAHESWNLRDRHMFDTLQRLLASAGAGSKAVVWAHNSHIGDARFTDMGVERNEINLGQLCRQSFGENVALIGFGTHSGTVAAASEWDGPTEIKEVRPSRHDSHEALFHDVRLDRFLLDLRSLDDSLRDALSQPRLERYIGVIYRPDTERWSHYSFASLADQYDAFVWFDRTTAVAPVPVRVTAGEDETYPSGL